MNSQPSTAKVYSLLFLSIAALSQAAILVKLANAPAEVLGFWRMLFTLLLTTTLLLHKREKINWKYVYQHRTQVVIAGVLFWLHFYLWFFAVQQTTIANAVVLFNVNPVIISLISVFVFREKLTKSLWIALVFGVIGILIIEWGSMKIDPSRATGDVLAIVSAAAFAGYTLSVKSLRAHKSNLVVTFLLNVFTTVMFLGAGILRGKDFFNYPLASWLSFFAMAAVPSMLGHSLFTYALKYTSAAIASCSKLLEPALAAIVAAIAMNEPVSASLAIGFIVIVAGLLRLFLIRE